MGIDIYLHWSGQTEEEKKAQYTGFSIDAGRTGYLREAYHGGPYATHILVREAFESETCQAQIPAAVMRERLTSVTEPARGVDGGSKAAEMIYSALRADTRNNVHCDGAAQPFSTHHTDPETVEGCVRMRCANVYPDMAAEEVEEYVKSFRDFVALAEKKEAETGEPCTVYASY
jgi:hypothetical protein